MGRNARIATFNIVKFLLTLISLAFVLNLQAQSFQDFPLDPTAEWSVQYELLSGQDMDCISDCHFIKKIGNDTVLNGVGYTSIDISGYCILSGSGAPPCPQGVTYPSGKTFIRQDSGRYYMPYGDSLEHLVFDFNIEVGDTIEFTGLVVNQIDSVDIDGHSCKRVLGSSQTTDDFWIIEGIGSPKGFFDELFTLNVAGVSELICYSHNGQNIIPETPQGCWLQLDIADDVASIVEIYPNPTAGLIQVKGLKMATNYTLCDLLGNLVSSGQVETQGLIDVTQFDSGTYFLNLQGMEIKRVIKL